MLAGRYLLLSMALLAAGACSTTDTPSLDRFEIGANGAEAPGGPLASTFLAVDADNGDVVWTLDVPWTPFRLIVPTEVGFVVPYPGPPGDVGDPGDQIPAGLAGIGLDGRPLWQVDLPGAPQSVVELDGDVLVVSHERAVGADRLVPTGRSLVVRIDGRTGLPVWRRTLDFLVGPVVVLDDELVMTDPGDLFVGLDPASGTELWSVPTRGRFDGGPGGKVVDDGTTAYFLVADPLEGPTVLGVARGAARGWPVPNGEFLISATPGIVVVGRDGPDDGTVSGFDPQLREELWSVPGAATSRLAGSEGFVVTELSRSAISGVQAATGTPLWSAVAPDRLDGATIDGAQAFTIGADEFRRFSLTAYGPDQPAGPLWRVAVPGVAYVMPMIFEDVVVAGGGATGPGADDDLRGWLAAVTVEDGELRWQIDPGAEPAAVASSGGLLYILTEGAPAAG